MLLHSGNSGPGRDWTSCRIDHRIRVLPSLLLMSLSPLLWLYICWLGRLTWNVRRLKVAWEMDLLACIAERQHVSATCQHRHLKSTNNTFHWLCDGNHYCAVECSHFLRVKSKSRLGGGRVTASCLIIFVLDLRLPSPYLPRPATTP
jgi:hypothetical protein